MADPAGRFSLAFGQDTLVWDATWTALDQEHPSLVTSYSIDRGRQFELDRTDAGRATVIIADREGILDPTNPSSPYAGEIQPLTQAAIARQHPITGQWYTRFRGFVEDFDYIVDPSQRTNWVEIRLVDIFEVLQAIEMRAGGEPGFPLYGDPPDDESSKGQILFQGGLDMRWRIDQVLGQVPGFPEDDFAVVFSGNVRLHRTIYAPGESPLTVVQEAADAEFPGVANVFTDRFGRLVVHGRLSKFYPEEVHAGSIPGHWDYHQWNAGDGAAVEADPTKAQMRRFAFNRGLAKIINHASATPINIRDKDVGSQLVRDTASIAKYGTRSWGADNLLTQQGLLDGSDDLEETKRFATYYVDNYAQPRDRISEIGFRSISADHPAAAATWDLLSQVDISDSCYVTVGTPGGGGFVAEAFFVEGVHETVEALTPDMDDVTLTLDLSPRAYFASNPWPDEEPGP